MIITANEKTSEPAIGDEVAQKTSEPSISDEVAQKTSEPSNVSGRVRRFLTSTNEALTYAWTAIKSNFSCSKCCSDDSEIKYEQFLEETVDCWNANQKDKILKQLNN